MNVPYIVAAVMYVLTVVGVWYELGATEGVIAASTIVFPFLLFLANALESHNVDKGGETETGEGTSNPHSIVETFDERKQRTVERLEPYFTIRETATGNIELSTDTEDISGADRAAMLWVFGRWTLADSNPEFSKIRTVEELRSETELKGGAVEVFLNKMEHFLVRHYPEDFEERHEFIDGEIVRMDEAEMEFELNEEFLEDIADYILGERGAPN